MHAGERTTCPVERREEAGREGKRDRAMMHALFRGCTMRARRVMRFVRHNWFSVGASFDRPLRPARRIDEQYCYFVSPSKG